MGVVVCIGIGGGNYWGEGRIKFNIIEKERVVRGQKLDMAKYLYEWKWLQQRLCLHILLSRSQFINGMISVMGSGLQWWKLCPTPFITATVGSQQHLCLCLLHIIIWQRKRSRSGILDTLFLVQWQRRCPTQPHRKIIEIVATEVLSHLVVQEEICEDLINRV